MDPWVLRAAEEQTRRFHAERRLLGGLLDTPPNGTRSEQAAQQMGPDAAVPQIEMIPPRIPLIGPALGFNLETDPSINRGSIYVATGPMALLPPVLSHHDLLAGRAEQRVQPQVHQEMNPLISMSRNEVAQAKSSAPPYAPWRADLLTCSLTPGDQLEAFLSSNHAARTTSSGAADYDGTIPGETPQLLDSVTAPVPNHPTTQMFLSDGLYCPYCREPNAWYGPPNHAINCTYLVEGFYVYRDAAGTLSWQQGGKGVGPPPAAPGAAHGALGPPPSPPVLAVPFSGVQTQVSSSFPQAVAKAPNAEALLPPKWIRRPPHPEVAACATAEEFNRNVHQKVDESYLVRCPQHGWENVVDGSRPDFHFHGDHNFGSVRPCDCCTGACRVCYPIKEFVDGYPRVPCPRHRWAGVETGPHYHGTLATCGCCVGTCNICRPTDTDDGIEINAVEPTNRQIENLARRNYEAYFQMPRGTVTLERVLDSSAGLGWALWRPGHAPPCEPARVPGSTESSEFAAAGVGLEHGARIGNALMCPPVGRPVIPVPIPVQGINPFRGDMNIITSQSIKDLDPFVRNASVFGPRLANANFSDPNAIAPPPPPPRFVDTSKESLMVGPPSQVSFPILDNTPLFRDAAVNPKTGSSMPVGTRDVGVPVITDLDADDVKEYKNRKVQTFGNAYACGLFVNKEIYDN